VAYCGGQDILNLALPIPALQSNLLDRQVTAVCQAASDEADGHFRGRWGYSAVPLLTWDSSITLNVARRSAYLLMLIRGMKPGGEDFKILSVVNAEALAFFNAVQRQQIHPLVTLANNTAPGGVQPSVITSSVVNLANGGSRRNRGW